MIRGIRPNDRGYEEYQQLQLTLCVLQNPGMHKEMSDLPEPERRANIEIIKEKMETLLEHLG